ncbi:MAG: CRISPR-associated endonuclease Cas2 [Saprospiraceae bacterium]
MPYLICYDITGDPLRTKIGKKIIAQGLDRINKSVYLGSISESSLKSLEQDLKQLIQTKGDPPDSLIILPLTAHEVQQMLVIGLNELDKDDLSGERSTLIFN